MSDKVQKILTITIIWTLISMFQFFIILNTLIDLKVELSDMNPWIPFIGTIITGLTAGLVGGTALTFLWDKWLRTKPYGWTIRNILLSFTIVFFIVVCTNTIFRLINEENLSIFSLELWLKTFENIISPTMIAPYIFWLIVVLLTMIAFLVNDKYGPGVFKEFLLGKYFIPKREDRVFMFLDLKSSTSIAEQLGEEKYFRFLNDVVKHITFDILEHKGEIYQYVGDEIVISWKKEAGFAENNCINCFLSIQKTLTQSKDHFQRTYGIIPKFKAGIHSGKVMTGEIGIVKRDIAFSGDVLNTASRIQNKCNELGVELLFSQSIIDSIKELGESIVSKEMGEFSLKGKSETVKLYTI